MCIPNQRVATVADMQPVHFYVHICRRVRPPPPPPARPAVPSTRWQTIMDGWRRVRPHKCIKVTLYFLPTPALLSSSLASQAPVHNQRARTTSTTMQKQRHQCTAHTQKKTKPNHVRPHADGRTHKKSSVTHCWAPCSPYIIIIDARRTPFAGCSVLVCACACSCAFCVRGT